jgi:hypothetical protein
MDDSHGRFRVRRGEVEIEYEGINFVQEYRAALAYFGIETGVQTRLEDASSETLPEPIMKPQTASHSAESPALMLSGIQRPKMESELERPAYGLRSRSPTTHQSERSTSKGVEANAPLGLVFNVLDRTNQRFERETVSQSPEQEQNTDSSIENRAHEEAEAYPTGMAKDDKFKDVLKRLGLAI